MDHLGTSLEIKTVSFPDRTIEGYAAIFGNADRLGDIIDPAAFTKTLSEKPSSAVDVLIGHNALSLPVGVPIEIRADGVGLWTKTLIKPGPVGDDLLHTAEFLRQNGRKLGMSIGYRARDRRPERKAGGGYVNRLMDIDLSEYSFASDRMTVNPLATVTSVKAGESEDGEELKAAIGSFDWTRHKVAAALREKTQTGCYIVEIFPTRAVYRTYSGDDEQLYEAGYSVSGETVTVGESSPVDVQYVPMNGTKAVEVPPVEMTQAQLDALPDSAFLYVKAGGQLDSEGKTVPRAHRFFPVQNEGKYIPELLTKAIADLDGATLDGLDVGLTRARARRMLESSIGYKTLDVDAPEWKAGAALQLCATADRLYALAEQVAEEQKARRTLGEDTKDGRRIRPDVRQMIADTMDELKAIVDWAVTVDKGAEETALLDRYQRELDLLTIEV